MAASPPKDSTLGKLMTTLPQKGMVTWIGIRQVRRGPVQEVTQVLASVGEGLAGDHFKGAPQSIRQVTLIQAEHIAAIASFLGHAELDPRLLRRNIVVKGINLLALKDKRFWVGTTLLEMTGQCHPCSRMEENLGSGGYNAVRGHGGITARVIKNGEIRVGDQVYVAVESIN